jgi:hypothetical protein
MSVSELPMKCRNSKDDVRTGDGGRSGISRGGVLKPGLCGIRLEGSMNLSQALAWNGRTCRTDAKGEGQVVNPIRLRVPIAEHRDRTARSREEGPVMGLDRRGRGVDALTGGQPVTGGAA